LHFSGTLILTVYLTLGKSQSFVGTEGVLVLCEMQSGAEWSTPTSVSVVVIHSAERSHRALVDRELLFSGRDKDANFSIMLFAITIAFAARELGRGPMVSE